MRDSVFRVSLFSTKLQAPYVLLLLLIPRLYSWYVIDIADQHLQLLENCKPQRSLSRHTQRPPTNAHTRLIRPRLLLRSMVPVKTTFPGRWNPWIWVFRPSCLSQHGTTGWTFPKPGRISGLRNLTSKEYPAIVPFPCGFNGAQTAEEAIHQWLAVFRQVSIGRLENAFNAAAFLANQAWMEFGNEDFSFRMDVYWDMGKDTSIPTFSVDGIVTVSILLGLYLFILIGLGFYSTRSPRWTEQFYSFAMMRIGASVADDVRPFTCGCWVEPCCRSG